MLTSQFIGEIRINTMRRASVDAPQPNTQTAWTTHQVSWRRRPQSVLARLASLPHQICHGSRLVSRGRTITVPMELSCRSTPMPRGYGSGLTVRSATCEGRTPHRKSKKTAGQPGPRDKKVGD